MSKTCSPLRPGSHSKLMDTQGQAHNVEGMACFQCLMLSCRFLGGVSLQAPQRDNNTWHYKLPEHFRSVMITWSSPGLIICIFLTHAPFCTFAFCVTWLPSFTSLQRVYTEVASLSSLLTVISYATVQPLAKFFTASLFWIAISG